MRFLTLYTYCMARYWDEGSEGEPVVLIHGLGGYVENWLPSFAALATQHRVVAVLAFWDPDNIQVELIAALA